MPVIRLSGICILWHKYNLYEIYFNIIVIFHISNYYYTKLIFSDRFWHVNYRGPSHHGAYAQNLQTHGLKNDDDVTLVSIFCTGYVGIYQTNLLWSKFYRWFMIELELNF